MASPRRESEVNASIYVNVLAIFFFEVIDRGAMQGSFRATFGVASVFVHVVQKTRMGSYCDVSPLIPGLLSSVFIKTIQISPVASSTSDN